MALSSAPYDQWYLAYIAYVPLFLQTKQLSSVKQGLAFALACSVIATNWWHSAIIFSLYYFLLIVGLLCISFGLWGYLTAVFRGARAKPLSALLMPAVIWVGIEYILSEWIGIPCNIGITQIGQPVLIQSASLFGIYTSSFIIIITNTGIAAAVVALRVRRLPGTQQWLALGVVGTLFGGNLIYGVLKLSGSEPDSVMVKVAVVQPVISSDQYINSWRDPDTRQDIKDTLYDLTQQALASDPDILVWPEGGNGYFNMRITELRDYLYNIAVRYETGLLISSNDLDVQGRKFNSVFSISKNGELLGRYDKVDLIPWAEDSFTAGAGFSPVLSEYGQVGIAICYESNYPSPLRRVTANGAELLFVSTSDAAFKKTSLTLNHTRTAVFRAIENNRWVIHASNTGPSVFVSPRGQITASTSFYSRNYLSGTVRFIQEKSFFTRFGYLLPLVFAVIIPVFLLFRLYTAYRLRNVAVKLDAAEQADMIEQRFEQWWDSLPVRWFIPAGLLYVAFLSSLAGGSVLLAYRQAEPQQSLQGAVQDFFAPLDTLRPDKVTEKFLQATSNTCGPAVMAYVFSYFGKETLEQDIVRQVTMTEQGTSMLELKRVAIDNGFRAKGVRENYAALMEESLPVIAYINDSHYVVVNKATRNQIHMYDPAIGHVKVSRHVFEQAWNGYLLLIHMQPIPSSISKAAHQRASEQMLPD